MKVTYIYHSSFYIELERHLLLFDYYKGDLPKFNKHKKLYVFVSHHHHDHFNKAIFHIKHPNITYILSDDVPYMQRNCYKVHAHDKLSFDDLCVKTLASTDEGVAFLVKVEQQTIYHAGDLHWWDWGSEDTQEEAILMKEAFQQEMARFVHEHINVAFIPVDPRLQENYDKGIAYVLGNLNVDKVFPMHFWEDIWINQQVFESEKCKGYQDRLQRIEKRNQIFII